MRYPGRLFLAALLGITCACGGNGKGGDSNAPTDGTGGDTGGGGSGGGGDQSGGGGTDQSGGGGTDQSGGGGDQSGGGGDQSGGGGDQSGGGGDQSGGGGDQSGGGGDQSGGGGDQSGGGGGGGAVPGAGGTVSGGQIPPGPGPAIVFSTYFGGSMSDTVDSVVVAPNGDVIIGGYTSSTDLPTTQGVLAPTYPGGREAGFVARLSGAGQLRWSTYIGGTQPMEGATLDTTVESIAVDATGAVYLTGTTTSRDLATAGAFQSENPSSNGTPFVAKLAADGAAMVWATYLGGSAQIAYQAATAIAVDDTGACYVAGYSSAADFPVTSGAAVGDPNGRQFVAKLDPTGKELVYGFHVDTVVGIAVGAYHELALLGVPDGSTTKLCSLAFDGSRWKWCVPFSPFAIIMSGRALEMNAAGEVVFVLGGRLVRVSADGKVTFDAAVAAAGRAAFDTAGDAWTAGSSWEGNLPVVNPIQPSMSGTHVYAARIRGDGVQDFGTYLGGSGYDSPLGIATDAGGDAVIVGVTNSPDLPTVAAFQPTYGGAPAYSGDGFVAVLRPFSARFTVPRGDDHHVWARMEANRPITGLDTRVNGGSWTSMARDSTGLWTGTLDVPPSSAVELRATGQGGVTSTTGRLYWPYAEQFPPPGPFAAKLVEPRGNASWVEVDVVANGVVTGVAARLGSGEWHPMSQTAWGSWAKAIAVPAGATVQVRVTGADGSTVLSAAWSWPPK